MDNAKYNTLEVKNICERKLKIEFRSNGEHNGWFLLHGKRSNRITIPKGRKKLLPKTYSSMARQLDLTTPEFDELLICRMQYEDYIQIIIAKKTNS